MTYIPNFRRALRSYTTINHQARSDEKLLKRAEIIDLAKQGMTRLEICDALGITLNTLNKRCVNFGIKTKDLQ